MLEDDSRVWNSIYCLLFTTVRGSEIPHGQLIQYLAAKFGEKNWFCQHLVLQVSLCLYTGIQYYRN